MRRTAYACVAIATSAQVLWALSARAQPLPASQTPSPQPPVTPSAAEPSPESAPRPRPPLRPLADAIALDPGATCLDPARLAKRIARWLQRDSVDAELRIAVYGDPTRKNGVRFVIERGQERAERSILDAPEDCDQLHAALALSIALAIDASLIGPGAQPGAGLPPDEQLLAPRSRTPEAPPYFRFAIGAFGHATVLLTDTSAAASVRSELSFLRGLDLHFGAFGTSLNLQPVPNVDGTFSVGLVAGRLDGCGALNVGDRLRLLACAGAAIGELYTTGKSFAMNRTERVLWSAAMGGLEAQAAIAPWFELAASVDLAVPFAAHRFIVVGPQRQLVGERSLAAVGVLVGAGPLFRLF